MSRPDDICGDCGATFDPMTPGARALRQFGIRLCEQCIEDDDREMQDRRRLRGDQPVMGRTDGS